MKGVMEVNGKKRVSGSVWLSGLVSTGRVGTRYINHSGSTCYLQQLLYYPPQYCEWKAKLSLLSEMFRETSRGFLVSFKSNLTSPNLHITPLNLSHSTFLSFLFPFIAYSSLPPMAAPSASAWPLPSIPSQFPWQCPQQHGMGTLHVLRLLMQPCT